MGCAFFAKSLRIIFLALDKFYCVRIFLPKEDLSPMLSYKSFVVLKLTFLKNFCIGFGTSGSYFCLWISNCLNTICLKDHL